MRAPPLWEPVVHKYLIHVLLLSVRLEVTVASSDTTQDELTSSLFVFRLTACDQDIMRMRCPHGTSIAIVSAQYGRRSDDNISCALPHPSFQRQTTPQNTPCLAQSSLQVLLTMCQDRQKCQVLASPSTFLPDPCPGASKYLKVAYQCKPTEFRRRETCEGEEMSLECPRSQRIVVYSAMFGSSGKVSIDCPAPADLTSECWSDCAVAVVKNHCHGNRRCKINASVDHFGEACEPHVPKYLSVIYTCVPRRILLDLTNDNAFPSTFCDSPIVTPSVGAEVTYTSTQRDLNKSTPAPEVGLATTFSLPVVEEVGEEAIGGFITDWIRAWNFISKNKEKLILYVVVSVLLGVILILLVILLRMVLVRRRKRQAKDKSTEDVIELTKSSSVTPIKAVDSVDYSNGNGSTPVHYPASETQTLLEEEPPSRTNGVQIPSYNHYNSLRFPPAHQNRQLPHTSSLDRRGMTYHQDQPNRAGSPAYNNTFRTSSNRLNHYIYS